MVRGAGRRDRDDPVKVHHLNCATMCPRLGWALGYRGRSSMVCHVLLVEAPDGLVLVDTGLGLLDIATPGARLGRAFVASCRPKLDVAETAASQVQKLGFSVDDVRHIVLTHLDLDHAGGISDFPNARAHVFMAEHEAAVLRTALIEKHRYRTQHVDDYPRWSLYAERGDTWQGFSAVSGLQGLGDQLLLVPLVGHTRGHCGVALQDERGWILHAGDSYFHHREIEGKRAPMPIELFERGMQMDGTARRQNQARLADLHRAGDVRIFCAHDPNEFVDCGGVL